MKKRITPFSRFASKGLFACSAGMLLVTVAHAANTAAAPAGMDAMVQTVMQAHQIPGMAIAIIQPGKTTYHNYGVASRETGQPVRETTLFEIGSLSKPFTALVAQRAETEGRIDLSAPASRYVTALRGSAFDRITLRQLGTYSAGGLPLQFPDNVTTPADVLAYYRHWQPVHPAGTTRLYSNPSIGLMGLAASQATGESFAGLLGTTVLQPLGMNSTYLQVPPEARSRYAMGYTVAGKPVRVSPGPLDEETYGVKSTTADMAGFLLAHMDPARSKGALQSALQQTRVPVYCAGQTRQGLGWESYQDWKNLDVLLAGNSNQMVFEPQPVKACPAGTMNDPDVWVNKTGSTAGFGAYAVFLPARQTGIVILANRNYPIADRIRLAHGILTALH